MVVPIQPGHKLVHYEILDPIGKGGMGEVYRAKDSKLGREVAIKVLPEAVAKDPERLGRFEREARLLASLNHPNIATIHGLERGESEFLVPPRPATKPSTSSWPRPSMITTSASAWSPPSRHSLTTWFGIRICTASFPEASFVPTDSGFPFPTSTPHAAEILFREKVFRLLQEHDLLSDECIKILRSWRWSGFSIDNDVFLYPSDTQALETLCRYVVRCPVSLRRLHYDKKSNYVLYQPKSKNRKAELPVEYDPLDFLARVLIHIPQPNQHSILYYGHYARRTRKHTRKKKRPTEDDDELNATQRKTLRRRWANLIRRVFKTDPLICKNCGGRMRVVSFITEPSVIRQILDHLQNRNSRDPPIPSHSLPQA